ncbi:hypothetical protein L209DRAFT_759393 [Thermothelomyces heterothallicus CBS 203.75]
MGGFVGIPLSIRGGPRDETFKMTLGRRMEQGGPAAQERCRTCPSDLWPGAPLWPSLVLSTQLATRHRFPPSHHPEVVEAIEASGCHNRLSPKGPPAKCAAKIPPQFLVDERRTRNAVKLF